MTDKIKARLKRLKEISDPDVIEALEIAIEALNEVDLKAPLGEIGQTTCENALNSIAEKLGVS